MPVTTKKYSIQEISRQLAIPASTLRYYEKQGLLQNVHRAGKHRLYTTEHIDRLGAIQCFKKTGMSLKQIKDFFYHEDVTKDPAALVFLLENQCEAVKKQIAELEENKAQVERKLQFYTAKITAQQDSFGWTDFEEAERKEAGKL